MADDQYFIRKLPSKLQAIMTRICDKLVPQVRFKQNEQIQNLFNVVGRTAIRWLMFALNSFEFSSPNIWPRLSMTCRYERARLAARCA